MNQTAALTCLHLGIKVKPVHWTKVYMHSLVTHEGETHIQLRRLFSNRPRGEIPLSRFESESYNYEYEKVIL